MIIVVAGFIAYSQLAGGPVTDLTGEGRWYYDLGSGELFATDALRVPPIEAPSGGEGVEAVVFSCGQCDDPANRHIAYLITTHPDNDTVQMMAELPAEGGEPQWWAFNTDEAMRITETLPAPVAADCPDSPTRCLP